MQDVKKHLNHPFYGNAARYWLAVQNEQIIKGAYKYPEPFNPDNWTSSELLEHAAMENVDQMHYIYGLYNRIEKLEKENQELKDELKSRNNA